MIILRKKQKMINIIKIYYPIILGGIIGYLYYHYIGCWSGHCPITSNPYISIIYGSFIGLVFSFEKIKKGKNKNDKESS